ncbi:SDR family NAD(P)-dependent oxidoreductase [Variovorax ginsengisoli]|uniref:NAD(P)-dependent dehydrogenase (Short-subunit alcohol dehydrogenase family) n=1 Tax=Variovorax ginsengisoli TaxID=363844 RepID=A0ABT9SDT9_9BURK|nr:SDR family oxidoreductase [Variovorax ginsengisoli]MDP9901953.1 NAD(P)-dependent dehydrogenase (short-subunit alcohol dehydrogenase family) [Variovorax ginsengisoli]
MEFENKTVLITGAATGIGRATARELARLGSRIVIADLNGEKAEEAASSIRADGGEAMGMHCDVTRDDDVAALIEVVVAKYGHVDVLINNASMPPIAGKIEDIPFEAWETALQVNVLGYVRMIRAVLPAMMERGSGYLVNTASSLAILPDPPTRFQIPYTTTKGAQLGMGYGMAHALRPHGVRVSVFCPSITATSDRPGGQSLTTSGTAIPSIAEFLEGVDPRRGKPATAEFAASVLIEGLRQEKFLISSQVGYEEQIVEFAQAGLDPLALITGGSV